MNNSGFPAYALSMSVEKYIIPISLTPIAAKVFESLVMKWFDGIVSDQIDDKQFGGVSGTSTTDASGDGRQNVVCVAWCADVRSFPAKPIKSGCFPLTMSTANNCWSSLCLLMLHVSTNPVI